MVCSATNRRFVQGGVESVAGSALDSAAGVARAAALLLRMDSALRGGRDRLAAACRVGADGAAQLRKVRPAYSLSKKTC